MDSELLKQRLAFLKKELALKRRKLEKHERKQKAKEHVRMKLQEQADLENVSNSEKTDVLNAGTGSKPLSCKVRDDGNVNVDDRPRQGCVSFQLSSEGSTLESSGPASARNAQAMQLKTPCGGDQSWSLPINSDSSGKTKPCSNLKTGFHSNKQCPADDRKNQFDSQQRSVHSSNDATVTANTACETVSGKPLSTKDETGELGRGTPGSGLRNVDDRRQRLESELKLTCTRPIIDEDDGSSCRKLRAEADDGDLSTLRHALDKLSVAVKGNVLSSSSSQFALPADSFDAMMVAKMSASSGACVQPQKSSSSSQFSARSDTASSISSVERGSSQQQLPVTKSSASSSQSGCSQRRGRRPTRQQSSLSVDDEKDVAIPNSGRGLQSTLTNEKMRSSETVVTVAARRDVETASSVDDCATMTVDGSVVGGKITCAVADRWVVECSSVNLNQDDCSHILSVDCGTVEVGGKTEPVLLCTFANGWSVRYSSGPLLHKWVAAKDEFVTFAGFLLNLTNVVAVLTQIRNSANTMTEYHLVSFSLPRKKSRPSGVKTLFISQSTIGSSKRNTVACATGTCDFVTEIRSTDGQRSAVYYTVSASYTAVDDTVKLEQYDTVQQPAELLNVGGRGCVCGISDEKLFIWHLKTGLLLQQITTGVTISCCSTIVSEKGLLFIPCLVQDVELKSCLVVVNPITAITRLVDFVPVEEGISKFNSMSVGGSVVCGSSASGAFRAWSLESFDQLSLGRCLSDVLVSVKLVKAVPATVCNGDDRFVLLTDRALYVLSFNSARQFNSR